MVRRWLGVTPLTTSGGRVSRRCPGAGDLHSGVDVHTPAVPRGCPALHWREVAVVVTRRHVRPEWGQQEGRLPLTLAARQVGDCGGDVRRLACRGSMGRLGEHRIGWGDWT